MKTEPIIPQTALADILQQEYGLSVEHFDFVPTDWTAYCYIVHCDKGERYFLKLNQKDSMVPYAISDPAFYLPLTYELHARGILPHIVHPIKARGNHLMLDVDNYHLVLYNYISGKLVGFGELPEDILEQLGGLVGILHRSINQIKLAPSLQERFDLAFEADLLRSFDVLQNVTSADRQGKQDLRDLILPRQAEILDLLHRLKELRVKAIVANKPMVFCHADLHGGNLMLDDQGDLYILDWEGAHIAPPERDLFFFAGDKGFWDIFLPAYEREFGPVQLDSALFGYYFHHRNLEDLTDWIVRILNHNTTAERDADDLNGIIEYSIPGWPYIEKTIQAIDDRLRMLK